MRNHNLHEPDFGACANEPAMPLRAGRPSVFPATSPWAFGELMHPDFRPDAT